MYIFAFMNISEKTISQNQQQSNTIDTKHLYTQAAYAKKLKKHRSWITYLIKEKKCTPITINGATLIYDAS